MQYHDVTTNSIWWTSAILQIVLSLYFSRRSADVDEIWSANANFGSKNGHVTKNQNFSNSKWWTAAILKIVFGYISAICCLINAQFGV